MGEIYYCVSRPIPPRAEFLTYYGDKYAREMKINVKQYRNGVPWEEHWDEDMIHIYFTFLLNEKFQNTYFFLLPFAFVYN